MKKIKITNYIIMSIISIFSIILCFINISKNNVSNSIKALIIIPIMFIPTILRKFFNIKFKYIIETIFILFIFLAYYLGYLFDIYNVFKGYDKFIHGISGLVTSFLALDILKSNKIYSTKNKWFNILFLIVFSLGLAASWEFVEFIGDKLFGKNDQGSIETGVGDTMYDLLTAFLGSIVFCVCYYYEITFKKSLIIKKYIKYLN